MTRCQAAGSARAPRRRCDVAQRRDAGRHRGRARRELRGRDDARVLEAAGAELLVLCTNTMHEAAGMIGAAVGIPFFAHRRCHRRRDQGGRAGGGRTARHPLHNGAGCRSQ